MKQKYKAIITDYDNTLVGFNQAIKENLRKKIIELKRKGLIFSIATGRPFLGRIQEACQVLQLTAPQIIFGGAQIINPVNQKVYWEELIPAKDFKEIVDVLRKKNLYVMVETDDCYFATNTERKGLFFFPTKIPLKSLDQLPFKPFPKIMVVAFKNNLTEKQNNDLVAEIKSKHTNVTVIKYVYDGKHGMDLTSEKATKHTAILEYMKLMKLKPEEVIGIGDNYNDYPLLTACGYKIAMDDAPKELLEIADFIAPPATRNGFLSILEKLF